ncbi:hypothetical protein [Amycolatopsis sp. cmx-11-51]|uniref:hypothetical protein n=1 Tax=unclassified Amycolatopsis TaxID=2618356 RepID=UPI0039E2AE12
MSPNVSLVLFVLAAVPWVLSAHHRRLMRAGSALVGALRGWLIRRSAVPVLRECAPLLLSARAVRLEITASGALLVTTSAVGEVGTGRRGRRGRA